MLSFTVTNYLISTYSSILLVLSNYILVSVLTFLCLYKLKSFTLKTNLGSTSMTIIGLFNVLFFLNLAGVPPLPGFFIKLNLLFNFIECINIYLILIVLVANFTIFYFYVQFYKNVYSYSSLRNGNVNIKLTVSYLSVALLVLLNFYPVYSVISLFII